MINSEDAKNWVTTAAIIIGGIWTWYEWDTLFPKTESEITISTASLRARTSGNMSVEFIPLPDGVEPTTETGQTFYERCENSEIENVSIQMPVRIGLNLSSNAPIPVRVEVTDFLIAPVFLSEPEISLEEVEYTFTANSFGDVIETPLTKDAFLGGLTWTHVEPNGSGTLAILGEVAIPFSCGYGGSNWTPVEVAIGLRTTIRGVEADEKLTTTHAKRHFFQICGFNLEDGSGNCSCNQPTTAEAIKIPNFKTIAQ